MGQIHIKASHCQVIVSIAYHLRGMDLGITAYSHKRLLQDTHLCSVWQLGPAWPDLLCWVTKQIEDELQLVDLPLAREEDLLGQELGHDTAQRPHINCCRVRLGTCMHTSPSTAGDHHVLISTHHSHPILSWMAVLNVLKSAPDYSSIGIIGFWFRWIIVTP